MMEDNRADRRGGVGVCGGAQQEYMTIDFLFFSFLTCFAPHPALHLLPKNTLLLCHMVRTLTFTVSCRTLEGWNNIISQQCKNICGVQVSVSHLCRRRHQTYLGFDRLTLKF